jgi:hypothetical protein
MDKPHKPYIRLAGGLFLTGSGLLALERYGLGNMPGLQHQLNGTVVTLLVLVPLSLIVAGLAVFAWGKMRRL